MDTKSLGEELFHLCKSERNTVAEIEALLKGLSEDQRREVVRYADYVSEP